MWGKDFDPDAHDKVVKEAVDEAFLPTVDVFLPVCNEDLALLNNTWKYVSTMDYPHYSVYVLDDGAKDDVRVLAAEYGFQCEQPSIRCGCFVWHDDAMRAARTHLLLV